MTNIQILKDSFAFAFKGLKSHFFRWMGYIVLMFLPIIIIGLGFVTKIFSIGNMVQGKLDAATVYSSLTQIELCLYVIGLLLAIYLLMSGFNVLIQNMFDYYDGKKFRGFSDPLISFSAVSIFIFQGTILGLLMHPGMTRVYAMLLGEKYAIKSVNNFVIRNNLTVLSLIIMIFALYVGLRLMLSYFIVIDTQCNPFDAVKKSWQITGSYICFFLLFWIITTVVRLIPFAGFFTIPVSLLVSIYSYRTLSK